jgi:uncharacterized protein
LEAVAKADVASLVPERSRRHYETFLRCRGCGRIYWHGSHAARLEQALVRALEESLGPGESNRDSGDERQPD